MFGLSLVGLRLFSVLAQVLVILVSGLMARDLGGGRLAQTFTAIAVALSPAPMGDATNFSTRPSICCGGCLSPGA
jgi:hypothetical protein